MTDWLDTIAQRHFPMQFPQGVTGKRVDMPTYFEIEDRLEPVVFPENARTSRWFNLPLERQDAGKSYLSTVQSNTHQDAVVFYAGTTPVGWSAGRMTGASEFMMDVTGIHPDWQSKGIYTQFLRCICPICETSATSES